MSGRFDRRSFVKGASALGLLALVPSRRIQDLIAETAQAGVRGRFLTSHELTTLRAVTDRFIPGPPEDPDPGAVQARCAEAIDLLLGAFEVDPPLIHAGGPFSNRAGARHDDFKDFVPLDRHAALGWRIRLEGSRGDPAREFGGPVEGLQQKYRSGLGHLDDRSRALTTLAFEDAPVPVQIAILSDQSDSQTQDFVGQAFADTIVAMYGPPEYGGNHGLVGWRYIDWPGDSQPRGFTDAEVSEPGSGPPLTPSQARAAKRFLPALASRYAPGGPLGALRRGAR